MASESLQKPAMTKLKAMGKDAHLIASQLSQPGLALEDPPQSKTPALLSAEMAFSSLLKKHVTMEMRLALTDAPQLA